MHFVAMIIVGLVAGVFAKLISPGPHSHNMIMTIVLGIAGSLVAGTIGHAIGWYRSPDDPPGIIASLVGALVILAVYHLIMRNKISA